MCNKAFCAMLVGFLSSWGYALVIRPKAKGRLDRSLVFFNVRGAHGELVDSHYSNFVLGNLSFRKL